MKTFSLLIKPASADCNLRCDYCFYLDRCELYPESSRHRMDDEMLERLVTSYMATDQPVYSFCWQGGEPTLMGLDFYQRATDLQRKHGRDGAVVSNALQTNGMLIDDELARHFAEFKYLLGVSLDGPEEVHNVFRRTADGRGTHADVLRGIDCLHRNRVEHNILTLVSTANARRGGDVYRYLREMGVLYHQYIPCVEFDHDGGVMPWTISGEEWGEFMCGVFDEWQVSDTRTISVRLFDSIIQLMVDGTRNVCQMHNNCCQYLLVEHNGDVYPCDFFVTAPTLLGNIVSDSWSDLLSSEKYHEFGRRKARWHEACSTCEYLHYCAGDCLKHRPGGELSRLCEGWKMFFSHALPRLEVIVAEFLEERRRQELEAQRVRMLLSAEKEPGRNDPCPCGSGKKYKKCHGPR